MQKLLALLSDGQFHSGEELGEKLGISRAAIWKKLKSLEELGLTLDSVRGRGYRLGSGIELLDEQQILPVIEPDITERVELHTTLSTGSTNDWVRELGKLPGDKVRYCLAEHQSGGRGRRGRVWQSPLGSTISLSALWNSGEGTASLEGLSLAVGLAVVKALESVGVRDLKLKWPNDILWQGKKLSGILLEVSGDPTGECQVIIGIGINIRLSDEHLVSIDQPATDLHRICGKAVSRNQVVGELVNSLSHLLKGFSQGGFALFRDQWCEYDAFKGDPVKLVAATRTVHGRCMGVNELGGLMLETDSGVMVFNGGEVSLRKS
ncbi:bifunctional biotin--[acetyl-CoA-carboxylase] synthetase/biotin operon repressor [Endozoicomonas sp. OPT23]|uniref:bifunctional biotin--[acetyl-CoA-carboxylase] ligase/biotin operon repressor BirA n=1 Tax=Endozoicomonas sp. OPT23 TaxID=2072845 RepID=UPI00129A1518|nr:bifunctional biotin--[acetyl-CoA-carboxylase] ligase/biotin operon repressor BirA [Endozoicomonas sp. OPT23]MRI32999.1 bifunctional biotin--[acetyl-CoA-carboxylase] synthetase/biotin operon repressor [Endozoicomonas sp. OPT23]